MASVELRQVSKVFAREVVALRDVDLAVRDREILVLLGPNGSGKTTLLRLIAGLDQPTTGEVFIGGEVVNGVPPRRRNVAMVFQGCVLYPHLTVERNIGFGLDRKYGGWPARLRNQLANRFGVSRSAKFEEVRERIRQTAKLVGVEHLLDRYPRQLSGGERQRVAIGRAFVRHPAVFLLDEPWSNVDDRSRSPLRNQLRRLCEQHCGTTILVTHDHREALALGDRIAVLDGGRLHQVGTPTEIASDPRTRFVAEFVGYPRMNFVAGQLVRRDRAVSFELGRSRIECAKALSGSVSAAGRKVWLGFRADAAQINVHSRADGSGLRGVVVPGIADSTVQVAVRLDEGSQQEIESEPLAVKVPDGVRYGDGQEVWLSVDARQMYFFDDQTGARI